MTLTLEPRLTIFEPYLIKITDTTHQEALTAVLNWVGQTFPELVPRLAWNQPMFTAHETFIIGFSIAKDHFNVALEKYTLDQFKERITAAGDKTTKMLWQIKFDEPVNYDLLKTAIEFNLTTKMDTTSFWR